VTIQDDAGLCQEVLGQRMTAFGCLERNPRSVGRWADGSTSPQADQQDRLTYLADAVRLLRELESDETIRALMLGANPGLNDQAPIEVLRDGHGRSVVAAADSFLSH
jgi:hypothetical protein